MGTVNRPLDCLLVHAIAPGRCIKRGNDTISIQTLPLAFDQIAAWMWSFSWVSMSGNSGSLEA